MKSKLIIFFTCGFIALILDLITKSLIFNLLDQRGASIILIEGFLYFTKALNPGVAFGMLQNAQFYLTLFIPIILIGLPIYIWKAKDLTKVHILLFGFIFGGALGNYYDRIFNDGKVRDFIDVKLFNYDYPIFNIADAFISCSVVVMLILSFFEDLKQKKKDESQ